MVSEMLFGFVSPAAELAFEWSFFFLGSFQPMHNNQAVFARTGLFVFLHVFPWFEFDRTVRTARTMFPQVKLIGMLRLEVTGTKRTSLHHFSAQADLKVQFHFFKFIGWSIFGTNQHSFVYRSEDRLLFLSVSSWFLVCFAHFQLIMTSCTTRGFKRNDCSLAPLINTAYLGNHTWLGVNTWKYLAKYLHGKTYQLSNQFQSHMDYWDCNG